MNNAAATATVNKLAWLLVFICYGLDTRVTVFTSVVRSILGKRMFSWNCFGIGLVVITKLTFAQLKSEKIMKLSRPAVCQGVNLEWLQGFRLASAATTHG